MDFKQLQERKGNIIHQMKDIAANARKENRNLTDEERSKFDKAEADLQGIEADEKRFKTLAALEAKPVNAPINKPQSLEERRMQAFDKYLRQGKQALSREERSVLTRGTSTQVVGTDNLGGYTVPQGFDPNINVATAYVGNLEALSMHMNTGSGNTIKIPTVDDTGTDANLTAEAAAVTVQDITFGEKELGSYNYATLVRVSEQLLNDNDVNIAALINQLGLERNKRATNAAFTTGTGSSQPQGVITGAASGKTAASATAFTQAELLDLFYSVDASYRTNARFMCSDTVHANIRALGLTASQDSPAVRISEMGELFINGKPVEINNDMSAAMTTGQKVVLFADFKQFYTRSVGSVGIKRLNERYADELEVGFLLYRRVDSVVVNNAAVKYLELA